MVTYFEIMTYLIDKSVECSIGYNIDNNSKYSVSFEYSFHNESILSVISPYLTCLSNMRENSYFQTINSVCIKCVNLYMMS